MGSRQSRQLVKEIIEDSKYILEKTSPEAFQKRKDAIDEARKAMAEQTRVTKLMQEELEKQRSEILKRTDHLHKMRTELDKEKDNFVKRHEFSEEAFKKVREATKDD